MFAVLQRSDLSPPNYLPRAGGLNWAAKEMAENVNDAAVFRVEFNNGGAEIMEIMGEHTFPTLRELDSDKWVFRAVDFRLVVPE